jgi:hypothetical protein
MAAAAMVGPARLLVHGGRRGDGSVLDDAWLFDAKEGKWIQQASTGRPRCAHAAGLMWVPPPVAAAGPHDGKGTTDQADAACDASAAAVQLPESEAAADAVPLLVLHGGFSGAAVESSTFAIDPSSLATVALAPGAGQQLRTCERFAHCGAAVPAGAAAGKGGPQQHLVVFGGVNPASDLGDAIVFSLRRR